LKPAELYFSVDVEADGPIPGVNSMLSLGCAVFDPDGHALGTYSANLKPLPDATPNEKTMAWWATQPKAWEACQQNPREPSEVMPEFAQWVLATAGENVKPVFAAWPVGFDFTYVYWYLMRFHGHSPFSHHALDIRSFAMAFMNLTYRSAHKSKLQKRLKDRLNLSHHHDHIALHDAIEQGELLVALLAANRDLHEQKNGDRHSQSSQSSH
jgi:hypothetical protein